jgi:TonB family protein
MQRRSHFVLITTLSLLALMTPLASDGHAGEASSRPDTATTTRGEPATEATAAPTRTRERTIAPFPVPGDTSARSRMRWRTLNLPRSGITTIAPLPAPNAKGQTSGASGSALPTLDSLLRKRLEQHQADCNEEFTDLPEPVHRVAPVVPPGTTTRWPKPIIKVFAVVSEEGLVEAAQTAGPPSSLDSTAVACVRQWRFKPAMHCGHAFPVWVAIPIRFDGR